MVRQKKKKKKEKGQVDGKKKKCRNASSKMIDFLEGDTE